MKKSPYRFFGTGTKSNFSILQIWRPGSFPAFENSACSTMLTGYGQDRGCYSIHTVQGNSCLNDFASDLLAIVPSNKRSFLSFLLHWILWINKRNLSQLMIVTSTFQTTLFHASSLAHSFAGSLLSSVVLGFFIFPNFLILLYVFSKQFIAYQYDTEVKHKFPC